MFWDLCVPWKEFEAYFGSALNGEDIKPGFRERGVLDDFVTLRQVCTELSR